jgi:hypothetical protein
MTALQIAELCAEEVAHDLRRRHCGAAAHAVRQDLACSAQDFFARRRAVVARRIANQKF